MLSARPNDDEGRIALVGPRGGTAHTLLLVVRLVGGGQRANDQVSMGDRPSRTVTRCVRGWGDGPNEADRCRGLPPRDFAMSAFVQWAGRDAASLLYIPDVCLAVDAEGRRAYLIDEVY